MYFDFYHAADEAKVKCQIQIHPTESMACRDHRDLVNPQKNMHQNSDKPCGQARSESSLIGCAVNSGCQHLFLISPCATVGLPTVIAAACQYFNITVLFDQRNPRDRPWIVGRSESTNSPLLAYQRALDHFHSLLSVTSFLFTGLR